MKKPMRIIYFLLVTSASYLNAQDFKATLKTTLDQFEKDTSITMFAASVNRLELIAGKWDDQWLAHYYAAYGESIYSLIEKDEKKRDALIDKAEIQLQQAEQLHANESDELFVLRALIASARLSVKPMNRWKEYGEIFNQNISSAKSINPANPRIYYLQGNSLYYTPKMFGGGAANAMPYYVEADSLYQQVKIDSLDINPSWGKLQNAEMLDKCRQTEKSE
jgi:hypothetical protein